jgi:hypothetical protein
MPSGSDALGKSRAVGRRYRKRCRNLGEQMPVEYEAPLPHGLDELLSAKSQHSIQERQIVSMNLTMQAKQRNVQIVAEWR